MPALSTLPRGPAPGLIPTLNHTGFMSEHPDACSLAFVDFAAAAGGEALDIGCAYGVATLAALAKGACVLACDMEPRHLEILVERVPLSERSRLRTLAGRLPEVDFAPGSFAAILCSRALHFLRGPDIETCIAKFHGWLTPGGKLFVVTDTPYSGYWKAHAPVYEERKRAGDPWPGLIADTSVYLPAGRAGGAGFLNPCDPDILRRVCAAAGFAVESAAFIARNHGPGHEYEPDTRDHATAVARKD
jgi:SAM-dependent methyltransferase